MKTIGFAGPSGSGKTRLIGDLIVELKKRQYSVFVIKHCPHGFQVDREGKDSSKYQDAGADGFALYSDARQVIFQNKFKENGPAAIAGKNFPDADFVLVEGGHREKGLKKIELLLEGISESGRCSPDEVIAFISDKEVDSDKPVFSLDHIGGIADFLESLPDISESGVRLEIDGTEVAMNPFVQKIFEKTLKGMVSSLEGIPENPKRLNLTISSKE